MTIDEIFREYHLDDNKQKYKIRNIINGKKFLDLAVPDEYLKFLVGQIIQTIIEKDDEIRWKPVVITVFTELNQRLYAGSTSINKKCKLLLIDSRAMKLFGDIAKLVEKVAPKYEGEITLNPESGIEDLKEEIRESINGDIYKEFKKAILVFNGYCPITDSVDEDEEPVGIARLIRDACMLFLLGHEFAHIWRKHKTISDEDKDAIPKRWRQEQDADAVSYRLMVKTMERLNHDIYKIKHKGQFDLGFEIFFQSLAIFEPLLLIFDSNKKYEYSTTHPDESNSRLGILRGISTKQVSMINDEDARKKTTHDFSIFVSNEIFDAVNNKIISEILRIATRLDKQEFKGEFITEILKNICNIEYFDGDNKGMDKWEEKIYIATVREFKNDKHSPDFYRILAVFYDYILERSYSRMYSCIGQDQRFRNGIEYLKQKMNGEALICFSDALNKEPDNIIIRLAYGLTCSIIGQELLEKKKYKGAEIFFERDLNINHLAGRESFKGHIEALKEQEKNSAAPEEDDKISEILSYAPARAERVREFMNIKN